MRILDENGIERQRDDLDFDLGYLKPDKVFVRHHEAIPAVEEQKHKVVTKYPKTGGVDIRWIVDVPAQEAVEAWDEYEDILRYVLYTPEELEVNAPRNIFAGECITIKGTMYKAILNIPNGECIITGQNAIETTIEEQLAELAKGE